MPPIARNDPCPCGSGLKYKRCCMGRGRGPGPPPAAADPLAAPPAADLDLLLELAAARVRLGAFDTAIELYQQVLRHEPRHTVALHELARTWTHAGQPERGVRLLRQAIAIDDRAATLHASLAGLLGQVGRTEEALAAARRAVALDPADLASHIVMADCLERLHRTDEAMAAAETALGLDRHHPGAGLIRARLLRRRGDLAPARRQLEAIIDREQEPHVRGRALHELGVVHDRLGDCGAAFDAFRRSGVELGRDPAAAAVDHSAWSRRIEHYRRAAAGPPAAAPPVPRDDLAAPIHLVGFPRSGTTLLEQVLAAHPAVVTSGERPIVQAVRAETARTFRDTLDVTGALARLDPVQIARLRHLYWRTADAALGPAPAGTVVIDKNPMDLVDLGMVEVIFPEAKAVVVIRDPRDVCLSCFMQEFTPNEAMVNFLSLPRTVEFYAEVMDLYLHQRPRLKIARLEVRYEDLVADLRREAQRTLEFLGLPWNDGVLTFQDRARRRAIATPSYAAVTGEVTAAAVGRWRRYRRHLEPLLAPLERFVQAFGYEPSDG